MKILYITDLHGIKWKFNLAFKIAVENEVDMVINGGDLCPNHMLLNQDKFIREFLDPYFEKFNSEKIYHLTYLGNDDLIIFDEVFDEVSDNYPYIISLAQRKFEINDYEFIGMNWVCDYPFRLKDRCRMDHTEYIFQKQFGKGILSTPNGWKDIEDWFTYAETLPTIEDEMNQLVRPESMDKAIYAIHMPPYQIGLDVCGHGAKVGSKAIYDFLKENQPLMSLHGHIHESPEYSNRWWAPINKTTCIQPGQSTYNENILVYTLIELDTMQFERKMKLKDGFSERKRIGPSLYK